MTCPVCKKPTSDVHKPFCSGRCRDVDLAKWLRGDYAIPGRDGEAADDVPPSPTDDHD